jgi:hypothetical protein
MLRRLRRSAVVAIAAGAAIAAQLAATGQAQAVAAPAITIAVTSGIKPVTGDVFVVYRGGALAGAKIHGTITGAAAGEVAALYAQQFPYKTRPVRLGSLRLKAATTAYSFTVTPTLATHYAVRLFTNGVFTTQLASSQARNIYVVAGGGFTGGAQNCSRPVCHQTFHVYTIVPISAVSVEIGKHLYPYFGLNLGSVTPPPPPNKLLLNAGHPSVTGARRMMNPEEWERTVTFSFTIGGHSYYWLWLVCTQDSVSKDGLGLPGSHGCGASQVLRTVTYLG